MWFWGRGRGFALFLFAGIGKDKTYSAKRNERTVYGFYAHMNLAPVLSVSLCLSFFVGLVHILSLWMLVAFVVVPFLFFMQRVALH